MQTDHLFAIAGGLAAHAVYKRREPLPSTFLASLPLVFLAAASYALTQLHHSTIDTAVYAVQLLSLYLASLATSIAVYRLSPLHPLSRIPGPPLACLTQWYTTYYVARGTTRFKIKALHDHYGDLVRIGPNELSVRRADAILQITGAKSWIKGLSCTLFRVRSLLDEGPHSQAQTT